MTTRWARFARGWVVAVFSTFVAVASHTLGGGAAPGVLPIVLSLAFAGIVCVGLAGRTLAFWRGAVSVLLSQLVFHGLFSLGAPGGTIAADGPGGHHHVAWTGLLEATSGGGLGTAHSAAGMGAGHSSAAMWLAHLVAAGVTIVALRHGERSFWGLFESARLAIRALIGHTVTALAPPAPLRVQTTAPVFTPRDLGVLLVARPHRGPPRFA